MGDDPHHEGEECIAFSRLMSAVGEAMAEAMRAILTAAGLEVFRSSDDCDACGLERAERGQSPELHPQGARSDRRSATIRCRRFRHDRPVGTDVAGRTSLRHIDIV